jgi:F-type H+-transporting ATPase subunit gamma
MDGDVLFPVESTCGRPHLRRTQMLHNHPTFGAVYEPVGERLVPRDHAWQHKLAAMAWPTKNLPEIIEGAESALPPFVRGYLFVLLFQACAESLASENASRLAAMQRAEKNIEDILENLNRTFRRVRQESIDEELFDVISGFEALTGSPRHT